MKNNSEDLEKILKELKLDYGSRDLRNVKEKILDLYKCILNFEKQKRSKLNQYSQNGEKISKDW